MYGNVQRRRRTFIFAYKRSTVYAESLRDTSVRSIIESYGMFAKAFPIHTIESEIRSVQLPPDLFEVSDNFKYPSGNAVYVKNGIIYTATVNEVEETPVLLGSILEKNVSEKYYFTTDQLKDWAYMKGSKRIDRTAANGHKYTFSEGPIAFPDPWDRPARTMLTSEGTKNRSSHVVADPGTGRIRRLTPVETERIQGFDDNWTNTGMTERQRYFCIGNALVVPLITRMRKILDQIIEGE